MICVAITIQDFFASHFVNDGTGFAEQCGCNGFTPEDGLCVENETLQEAKN
jgi:hypothetical protein